MKPFSLEEYLKNPERKVVTRDGKNTRIICTDFHDDTYPIIALLSDKDGSESIFQYTEHGTIFNDQPDGFDLFFAPEKHEGWINIFRNIDGEYAGDVFYSEEEALIGTNSSKYVTTIKIEWKE